jgi:Rod binding domain-containing protein
VTISAQQIAEAITLVQEAGPMLKKLKEATNSFESVFVKQLLAEMRKSSPKVQFGETLGAEMYEDMMDQAVADAAVQKESIGIGRMLYDQFAPVAARAERMRLKRESPNDFLAKERKL